MEEDRVALLHLQVNSGLLRVVVAHAVVHFVHAALEKRDESEVVWVEPGSPKNRRTHTSHSG